MTYPEKCEECGEKATLWAKPDRKTWRGWCSKPCQRKSLSGRKDNE